MDTKELIQQRMAELRADVDEIKARVAPDRAQLDELIAQQNALDARIVEVTATWRRHDAELIGKKEEIAACARALGAKTLSGN